MLTFIINDEPPLNIANGAVSVAAGTPSATQTLVCEIFQLADLSNC